jgi:hypothetical protein
MLYTKMHLAKMYKGYLASEQTYYPQNLTNVNEMSSASKSPEVLIVRIKTFPPSSILQPALYSPM